MGAVHRGRGRFLGALASGRAPRAVWSALPGPHWPEEIARAAGTAAATGRGALIVLPDARDLDLVDAALAGLLGPGRHVTLAAGRARRNATAAGWRSGAARCRVVAGHPGRDVRAGPRPGPGGHLG